MLNYDSLFELQNRSDLSPLLEVLPGILKRTLNASYHGDFSRWQKVLESFPEVKASHIELAADIPSIGLPGDCDATIRKRIEEQLRRLHPWRKGPFLLHSIYIDSEWRSDWKWRRLVDHIEPLRGKSVLDIGCGNGYHCWRMAGAGAKLVIGIDPILLNSIQFQAVKHFAGEWPVYLLPLGIEAMPKKMAAFDTVFSMGVFYHRRSPFDHLLELRELLRSNGELVLETLVIEGTNGQVLVPEHRYARMRNVWFIPSCATLQVWLKRCGFRNIKLLDVTRTSTQEQRSTDWMRFESLAECLSPTNPSLTVEGYPSPVRAIFLAKNV